MILISHRGNINGPNPSQENHPTFILNALHQGYDVEIDVWYHNGLFMLGHDLPQYKFPFDLLLNYYSKLWIHCKNIDALVQFQNTDSLYSRLNYFWHEKDTVTLTSKNYIWAYPGKQPIPNSIAVMPELNDDITTECIGVCSDYIKSFNK